MKNNSKIPQVDMKKRWNGIAKFYLVCTILFCLFVAYIVVYRYINKNEVIENNNEQVTTSFKS